MRRRCRDEGIGNASFCEPLGDLCDLDVRSDGRRPTQERGSFPGAEQGEPPFRAGIMFLTQLSAVPSG